MIQWWAEYWSQEHLQNFFFKPTRFSPTKPTWQERVHRNKDVLSLLFATPDVLLPLQLAASAHLFPVRCELQPLICGTLPAEQARIREVFLLLRPDECVCYSSTSLLYRNIFEHCRLFAAFPFNEGLAASVWEDSELLRKLQLYHTHERFPAGSDRMFAEVCRKSPQKSVF